MAGKVVTYVGKRDTTFRLRYVDASGRDVCETLGGKRDGWTRQKAKAALRERLVSVSKERYVRPGSITFREYAERWLEQTAALRDWRPSTVAAYRAGFARLMPEFGPMKLAEIRPRHVNAWTKWATGSGEWSATTVNQDANLLHNVFVSAMREELVSSNPAHRAERPRTADREHTVWRILSPEETARVARCFTDDRARLVYLTALLTGMRRHEIVNLRWRDVDFIAGSIRVARSKSRDGIRSIALTPTLAAELSRWRFEVTHFNGDDDHVFANPETGQRLNPNRWWNRHWKAALRAAGIDGYVRPFHDLRHTSLTNEAAAGSSPVALMARAGHSSMATTNKYLHLAGVVFADEAQRLEDRLLGTTLSEARRDTDESGARA